VALSSAWMVYVRFRRLGGPQSYIAPL
jgi:hypothetical protein